MKEYLESYVEIHWWNMGRKTLGFKGNLKDALKEHNISFTKRKTDNEGIFKFYFKSIRGINYTKTGVLQDFPDLAKQAIQMELVRMGDKSTLYVASSFHRPSVTVNH